MRMTPAQRQKAGDMFYEAGFWLLFFARLVPAGHAGYAIGRATSHAGSGDPAPATRPATHAQTP